MTLFRGFLIFSSLYVIATTLMIARVSPPAAVTPALVTGIASMRQEHTASRAQKPSASTSRIASGKSDSPPTFSACLLVRDDEKILPEWLAYHYTVLPLRRLILAVDPFSIKRPHFIINAFESIGLNTTIWEERDFFYKANYKRKRLNADSTDYDKYQAHLLRQVAFMTECTKRIKQEGGSWVLLTDTDEYLTFNNFNENEGPPAKCGKKKTHDIADIQECFKKYEKNITAGVHPRGLLPTQVVGQPHAPTLAQYISSMQGKIIDYYLRYCIVIPRIAFGAAESTLAQVSAQVPPTFDPLHFVTLRFRKHALKRGTVSPGKSLVDVSRYDPAARPIRNCHRVLRDECQSGTHPLFEESLFRIHHYTGSKEQFTTRAGRSKGLFEYRSNFTVSGESDEVRGWLQAFVDKVGQQKAFELTEGLRAVAYGEVTNSTT